MTRSTLNSVYYNPNQFRQRSTISLLVFLLVLFLAIFLFDIFPTPRIPSSWYAKSVLSGIDPNAKITRGAMEAKKTHKPHVGENDLLTNIPPKYITSPTGLPLGNYVVMIDAGSSGSRVYVYQYRLPFALDEKQQTIPTNDPSADILHVAVAEDINHNPIVRKQEPGLSSFHENPQDAFTSIEPLLTFASQNIPAQLHSTTPVYIYATAGLRLTSESSRHAILDNVRAGLKRWSSMGKFMFTRDDQADMITGEQEGLYGWIALNYVYNRFGDLKRTYPTGGLDPHTYGTLPRMTQQRYEAELKQEQLLKRQQSVQREKDAHTIAPPPATKTETSKLSVIVDNPVYEDSHTQSDSKPAEHVDPKTGHPLPSQKTGTVALLEIGGGSAQVAFAVDDTQSSHPPNYVYTIDLNLLHCDYALEAIDQQESNESPRSSQNGSTIRYRTDSDGTKWPIGGHVYNVYTASFLGHGANAVRTRYINFLINREKRTRGDDTYQPMLLFDPCSIFGQAEIVTMSNGWGYSYKLPDELYKNLHGSFDTSSFLSLSTDFLKNDEILIVGSGDWKFCRSLLPELLPPNPPSFEPVDPSGKPKPSRCDYHCPINDQYQPMLTPELLARSQFFGFSEYWFLTRDVLRIEPHDFTGDLFDEMSKELCDIQTGRQHWGQVLDQFQSNRFPDSANEQRIRQQCFKGAWMSTMLHQGHGIPQSNLKNKITPVSSIEGSEVQWSLGAVILKVTQQVKNDRGFCLNLAREVNQHGLSAHLHEAKSNFNEDELTRLGTADYWGHDAGWEKAFFFGLIFAIQGFVLILIGIIFIYHKFVSTQRQETALYRRL